MQVVSNQGYAAATVERIAEQGQVSKGLVLHYFGTRDALMRRVAAYALSELRQAVAARITPNGSAADVVRSAIVAASGLPRTRPAELRSLNQIVLNLRDADGNQALTLHDYEDAYQSQEQIFQRGQLAGDFRTDLSPRVIAISYQGAVDAMLDHLDCYPDTDPADHARQLADLFLDGLRPR